MMLDKTILPEKSLIAARAELAALEVAIIEADKAERAASGSPEGFAQARANRVSLTVERDRLNTLIVSLEQEVVRDGAAEAAAALRERHAAKLIANKKFEQRIRTEVAKINAISLSLLRDLVVSNMEDQAINAAAAELDLEPLMPAEFQARGRLGLPRTEISRERVWLWTRADGGQLIGD